MTKSLMDRLDNLGPADPLQTPPQPSSAYRLPWLRIAVLGGTIEIAAFLIIMAIKSLSFGALLVIAIALHGVSTTYIVVHLLAIGVVYWLLRKWQVNHPWTIALSSMATLYGLFAFGSKLPSTFGTALAGYKLTAWERLYANPLFVLVSFAVAGALIFLLLAFVTNRLHHRTIKIVVLAIVAIGAVAINLGAFAYEPSIRGDNVRVHDLDWMLLPGYLPAGVVDGPDKCADQLAYSTWYECVYEFKNYPGYLSAKSQSIIDNAVGNSQSAQSVDDNYRPTEFLRVTVMKDDPLLGPYKFKNDRCDFEGLRQIGAKSLESRDQTAQHRAARLQRCIKIATPDGQPLYYDSYLNYGQEFAPVPTDFYFERSGRIVMFTVGSNKPLANTVTATYYLDENFQSELYKFVDSFR